MNRKSSQTSIGPQQLTTLLLDLQQEVQKKAAKAQSDDELENLRLSYLGKKGELTHITQKIKDIPKKNRKGIGEVVNTVKQTIQHALETQKKSLEKSLQKNQWIDITIPGKKPRTGHFHIVTQAIEEIEYIFNKIGFYRVRHPEVDTDWYAFESLNMPPQHPARDEWETFFIKSQKFENNTNSYIVLTPHTSNGQVREMERVKKLFPKNPPPIRMINIARCYRRQLDVSHTPMFHQFEGLYIDEHVSITHLKGVLDYFVQQFFGIRRKSRIRPFHFQFTEPSFEVDISCDICEGKGCRLCKEGWLELGGAGMVHPVVLKNGGFDPRKFSGFAFGWGIERTYMMKEKTKIDDIRILYNNDIRFLEQF